jgi:hypothetical protein
MQVFRKILNVKNHLLKIELPDDFNANKVEVIVLPLEEKAINQGVAKLRGKLKLTHDQYNEFQKDVKNSRDEWEKNI